MSHIELGTPTIIDCGDKVRICVDITIIAEKTRKTVLWYELDREYKEYLYKDRVDPFLVAILPYCMEKGLDIQVSERTGISADLFYQLTKILLPSLKFIKHFQAISINALPVYTTLKKGEGIATGVSRGVDSFYTILNNIGGMFPLTHLALFNTQSYGEYGGEASRQYFHKEIEKAEKICEDLEQEYNAKLTLVTVDTNIQEELPIKIFYSGSFRDGGAILLLRQIFKLYYFSSTVTIDTFRMINGRELDPWIFPLLCTENYRIQLFGADASRMDKVKYISEFPVTYDNLRVCLEPLHYGTEGKEYQNQTNCTCNCDKCRYTVMELLVAGKLECYHKVFDLKLVQEKYSEFLQEVIAKKKQDYFCEIYEALCQKGEINPLIEQEIGMKIGYYDDVPKDHDARILELMGRLLQKIQSKESIAEQLFKRGYQKVAIYGMGRLGKHLSIELGDMVTYVIDRNKDIAYKGVLVRDPGEELPPVDLIVVTTVYHVEGIREFLAKKTASRIMTLEEVLNLEEMVI